MQGQLGGFYPPRIRQMGDDASYELLTPDNSVAQQPQRPPVRQRQYGCGDPTPRQQQG